MRAVLAWPLPLSIVGLLLSDRFGGLPAVGIEQELGAMFGADRSFKCTRRLGDSARHPSGRWDPAAILMQGGVESLVKLTFNPPIVPATLQERLGCPTVGILGVDRRVASGSSGRAAVEVSARRSIGLSPPRGPCDFQQQDESEATKGFCSNGEA